LSSDRGVAGQGEVAGEVLVAKRLHYFDAFDEKELMMEIHTHGNNDLDWTVWMRQNAAARKWRLRRALWLEAISHAA
jgi:hypothetical protein